MIIANPIYDVVFKYLMEDLEIARLFLSRIIGEDIVEVKLEPQEHTSRSERFEIIIFRLDFKAIIKTKEGIHKKVLIELQKGKTAGDIMRFRKYLGDNYRKEDMVQEPDPNALPIITIYFLGFRLKNIETSILKVNREYLDLVSGETLHKKEAFIEQLTHDCFVIQIPRLKKQVRTELERLLKVFNQAYTRASDYKTLEIAEPEIEGDKVLEMMVNRLRRAATEEAVLRGIEIEEEVENVIEQHIRDKQELKERLEQEISQKEQEISQKEQEISQKEQEISQKEQEISQKEQEISQKDQEISQKEQEIEALKALLKNRQ